MNYPVDGAGGGGGGGSSFLAASATGTTVGLSGQTVCAGAPGGAFSCDGDPGVVTLIYSLTVATPTPTPTATPTPTPTREGSVKAATPVPSGSLPNSAFSAPGSTSGGTLLAGTLLLVSGAFL